MTAAPYTKHVCVITSCHPALDQRIYFRSILALLDAGYKVSYIAPAASTKLDSRVDYHAVQNSDYSRLQTQTRYFRRICKLPFIQRLAASIRADYYHFHDPDLIPVALRLKSRIPQCIVFCDIHEYYPRLLRGKSGLVGNMLAQRWISYARSACLRLDHTFVAVEGIATELALPQTNYTVVHNYADPELFTRTLAMRPKELGLGAYVGTISEERGADYLLRLADDQSLPIRLVVVGRFSGAHARRKYEEPFRSHPRIEFHENIGHHMIPQLVSEAQFALSLPSGDAQGLPTKLIEYMALQCAVITTDCGIGRQLVQSSQCGMVVGSSYSDVRAAVEVLTGNPDIGYNAGKNGRIAFEESFNWKIESQRMLALYSRYADGPGRSSPHLQGP